MKMKIKAMFFDLDGTLIRIPGLEMFNEILRSVLEELNISPSKDVSFDKIWNSGKKYRDILKSWGVRDINRFWRLFDKKDYEVRNKLIREKIIEPYEDVEVLNYLRKKYELALITNTSKNVVELEIKMFDLEKYFSQIIVLGSEFQDHAKPEPDGIQWALDKLELKPREVLMIGDHEADILAGKNAGTFTALVERWKTEITVNPDFRFKNLYEVKKYF
ncbi:MAG: HAD family hydrolase [Candidatus Odinarchaeia archaeon]